MDEYEVYELHSDSGLTAWCTRSFYKEMLKHPKVIEAYEESLKEENK